MIDYKNVSTKLIINGFTLNPVTDELAFFLSVKGIANYKDFHICDYDKGNNNEKKVHKNYLGKIISNPKVDYIDSGSFKGWIGCLVLENGYFVIKIWDSLYPARIQLDLYLDEKMEDADLIIDSLCAPAVPFDGFGMFDYTYSLSYITKQTNIIDKDNNVPSYELNKFFDIDDYINKMGEYSIILNKLNKIQCYFCESQGEYFIFALNTRSIIPVCEIHKHRGSSKEFGHNEEELDKRKVEWYNNRFIMKTLENNNKKYTFNEDTENNGTKENI